MVGIPFFGHDECREDGPFDWVGGFQHDVDEVEAETLVGVDKQQPLGVTLEEGSDDRVSLLRKVCSGLGDHPAGVV